MGFLLLVREQLWNSLGILIHILGMNPNLSSNLSSFKSNINKLDLISLSTYKLPLIFSVFPLSGLCYRPYGLSPTLLTKQKSRNFFYLY